MDSAGASGNSFEVNRGRSHVAVALVLLGIVLFAAGSALQGWAAYNLLNNRFGYGITFPVYESTIAFSLLLSGVGVLSAAGGWALDRWSSRAGAGRVGGSNPLLPTAGIVLVLVGACVWASGAFFSASLNALKGADPAHALQLPTWTVLIPPSLTALGVLLSGTGWVLHRFGGGRPLPGG